MRNNDEQQVTKARLCSFRFLKIRLRSEYEIRTKLKQKNFTNETIDQTVQYLNDAGFLDDRIFAQKWTQSRLIRLRASKDNNSMRFVGISRVSVIPAKPPNASFEAKQNKKPFGTKRIFNDDNQ